MNAQEELKRLREIRKEQDKQLEAIGHRLRALGDVEIRVPTEVLDELRECVARPFVAMAPLMGMRG